jgi:hypothetical protein
MRRRHVLAHYRRYTRLRNRISSNSVIWPFTKTTIQVGNIFRFWYYRSRSRPSFSHQNQLVEFRPVSHTLRGKIAPAMLATNIRYICRRYWDWGSCTNGLALRATRPLNDDLIQPTDQFVGMWSNELSKSGSNITMLRCDPSVLWSRSRARDRDAVNDNDRSSVPLSWGCFQR